MTITSVVPVAVLDDEQPKCLVAGGCIATLCTRTALLEADVAVNGRMHVEYRLSPCKGPGKDAAH